MKLVKPTRQRSDDESIKREVMTYYGHQCVCVGCTETRLSELTLDHIRGGGNAERTRLKRRGSSFYREVKAAIDRGAPTDQSWLTSFQILCDRCNRAKLNTSSCPLHPVPDENTEGIQGTTETLPETPQPSLVVSNSNLADEKLVKLDTRVPESVMLYLDKLGCRNRGDAITQVVRVCQSDEPTLLKELRTLRADVMHALDGAQDQRHQPAVLPVPRSQSPSMHPDLKLPWDDQEQWDAWLAFKAEWDDRHPLVPTPLLPIADMLLPQKKGGVEWLKGVLVWFRS